MEQELPMQRSSSKLYETLLWLYPASYRRAHREELLQNFEDLERDAGSSVVLWTFIASDLISSLSTEYMEYVKKHRWAQFALGIFAVLVLLYAWQFATLQKAHSTFDNYAAFRGCEQITSHTDTQGTCTLASGQSIKMVQVGGRWYLDGDLPTCIGNVCF
ncbi:MAG: hypothetical protein P4L81_07440 [Candidatus Pacebacteria bacterium]|nr:hypothetical protein [Candidatus Paceibacterota bacterium]